MIEIVVTVSYISGSEFCIFSQSVVFFIFLVTAANNYHSNNIVTQPTV